MDDTSATRRTVTAMIAGAREALDDRRAVLLAGAVAVALAVGAVGMSVASGDLRMSVLLLLLVAAPFLAVLALKHPYVFPYGLYIVVQPFDTLLSVGSAGTVTKLIGILAALAIVVHAFRERRLVRPPFAAALALAYVGWMLLSTLWAVDAGLALTDVQTMLSLLLLYLVLASAPIGERELRVVCGAVVLSGIVAAVYGIWYFHQAPPDESGRLVLSIAGRQIDPNQFADSLLTPIALSVVALLRARSVRTVLLALAALAILGEGILITLSREAMLACVVVAFVIVLMSRRRLVGLAVLVPALATLPFVVPAIGQRVFEALATGGAGRTSIWQVDLHAWAAHPIIGWGAGAAFQAYNASLLAVSPHLFAGWSRPPHNAPLHVLVDLGLVGVLLLTAGYLWTFRQFAGIGRTDSLYGIRVALTAALVGTGVVSFFIDNAGDKYVWVLLATIAQLRTVVRTRPLPAPATIVYEPPPVPTARSARRFAS